MKKWILCMLSGGLDSTGALYKVLEDEQYKDLSIHVHSMGLNNVEGRAGAEFEAVMNIRKWFQKNYPDRELIFTRSQFEYNFQGTNFMWDADMTAFWSAQIIRCDPTRTYAFRIVGRTKTDTDVDNFDFRGRVERALEIYDVTWGRLIKKEKPATIVPVADMYKREIWDMLPPDLRELTWSCRTPKQDEKSNWIPCENCITCRDIRDMFDE